MSMNPVTKYQLQVIAFAFANFLLNLTISLVLLLLVALPFYVLWNYIAPAALHVSYTHTVAFVALFQCVRLLVLRGVPVARD